MPDRASQTVAITIVAAIGRHGQLGRDGALPFRLKSDLAHFRAVTVGKPVVMGRKTWESLPRRPLPQRPNIVVTRDANLLLAGGHVFASLPAALAAARAMAARLGVLEACLIGGGELYSAALPAVDRIWLTQADCDPPADVVFPTLEATEWRELSREERKAGEGDDCDFTVRLLERVVSR